MGAIMSVFPGFNVLFQFIYIQDQCNVAVTQDDND
jgi:hypothetical protein